MHNKSWSNMRKILEEDRLCPSLRGRVQYFMTRYHDAHDDEGRLCIRVDEKEYPNSHVWNGHSRNTAEMSEKGKVCYCEVLAAIDTYYIRAVDQ